MSIKYIIPSEKRKKDVIIFLNKALNRTVNLKIWNWEFETWPDKTVFVIADDDGRIAGTQSFLPIYLNYNGKKILTSKSESSFLDSDYRGKGIFESLYSFGLHKCKELNHGLIWGFTSATKVWKNNLHFNEVDSCIYEISIDFCICIDKEIFSKFSTNKFNFFFNFLYKKFLVNKRYRNLKKQFHIKNDLINFQIFAQPKSYSDMDIFFKRLRGLYKFNIHLEMSEDYINWRVINNPNLEYLTLYFYNQEQLHGYFIFTIKNNVIHLSDFTALDQNVANAMIWHLIKYMKCKTINKCYYFGNYNNALNKSIFDRFEKLGSKKNISPWANFVLKDNLGYNEPSMLNTANWYMNGLWTEGFNL